MSFQELNDARLSPELRKAAYIMYYNRDGTPILDKGAALIWAKQYNEVDRVVYQWKTWWGGLVSTVWLGLNHQCIGERPLIFETMVFTKDRHSIFCERYSTEGEAKIGHWLVYVIASLRVLRDTQRQA